MRINKHPVIQIDGKECEREVYYEGMRKNGIPDVQGKITWEIKGRNHKEQKEIFSLDDQKKNVLPELYKRRDSIKQSNQLNLSTHMSDTSRVEEK